MLLVEGIGPRWLQYGEFGRAALVVLTGGERRGAARAWRSRRTASGLNQKQSAATVEWRGRP